MDGFGGLNRLNGFEMMRHDVHRQSYSAGRAICAPTRERVIICAPPANNRSGGTHALRNQVAVVFVHAVERPIMKVFAPLSQWFFGGSVCPVMNPSRDILISKKTLPIVALP